MQESNSATSVRETILALEAQRARQGAIVREQLHLTYESIKPINLIRNTFKEVAASHELTDNIINTSVGLAAGYVSKTIFEKVSHSPFRRLLGTVLLFGVTNLVSKNPSTIRSIGTSFFNIVIYQLNKRLHT
jgi:hypothetical protein